MQLGVQCFPSPEHLMPTSFALAAEARGFESVFFPDHTHIPVPPGSPEDLPEFYRDLMDPVVAMASAAAVTARILVGTAICIVPQRDPIILAKQVASVDQLSGGRVLFGVGAGSIDQELRNHGTTFDQRFTVLRERVEAMTRIWADDQASYRGRTVEFPPLWSRPKPVQVPRPPVIVGGWGPRVVDRVLAYGDGWMPFRDGQQQVHDDLDGDVEEFETLLTSRMTELRAAATDRGRPVPPVTLFNACPHPRALDRYRKLGIERAIFWLRSEAPQRMLRTLDDLAALA